MNQRTVTGIITTGIGAVLAALAFYASNYISGIKGDIEGISSVMKKNTFGGFLSGEMHKKTSAYDYLVTYSFWAGVLIFCIGLYILYRSLKYKK
jgi:hypothetical protein